MKNFSAALTEMSQYIWEAVPSQPVVKANKARFKWIQTNGFGEGTASTQPSRGPVSSLVVGSFLCLVRCCSEPPFSKAHRLSLCLSALNPPTLSDIIQLLCGFWTLNPSVRIGLSAFCWGQSKWMALPFWFASVGVGVWVWCGEPQQHLRVCCLACELQSYSQQITLCHGTQKDHDGLFLLGPWLWPFQPQCRFNLDSTW